MYFLTVLEAEKSQAGCEHGQLLVRAFFLAGRPLSYHCVLTWWREKSGVSSYKGTSCVGSVLHLYDLI